MKTFQKNNDGISTINGLIIIIIIGILFWQFAIPIIDNSIPSLSDTIQTQNQPIESEWGLLNINTTEYSPALSTAYYQPDNVYKLILKSNVPYRISQPYYVSIQIYKTDWSIPKTYLIDGIREQIPLSAIWQNEFRYDLNLDTTDVYHYEIQISIFDYNDNAIQGMPYNIFVADKV